MPICVTIRDQYLLIDVGWDLTGRVHSVVLHLRLQDEKIYIEWDGIEFGVVEEMLKAGIELEDIVVAHKPNLKTKELTIA